MDLNFPLATSASNCIYTIGYSSSQETHLFNKHIETVTLLSISVVIPKEGTETWWTFLGLIDPRLDLTKSSSLLTYLPQFGAIKTVFGVDLLELMLMASKVAYENAAVVEYAVTKRWKMNFVGFYSCWNKFTKTYGTQAYIFTDTAKDASMIVVSFRGTSFWAAKDYVTDVDFSFLSMGKMGNVHIGLLKALGLQDEKDYVKGWPKDYTGDADKIPVYYVVREQLRTLIQTHPNAKIIFTGHSMGAALSSIYPALLSLHEETDILDKTAGILNNGRLRPGDEAFGNYMVNLLKGKYCLRVTYRYDIIVRVPFDNPFFQFKHFGKCIYYYSWYHGEVVMQEPNRNYFDLRYFPNMYYTQFKDFFTSLLILPIKEGKEYRETVPSLIYRAIGFAIPGVPCHSPRDYLNAIKLGKVTISDEEIV
ncbi:Phospholipase A1-IIbeta [Cinnamomum micranthum f. kanehirae]|uniref:Phospholipase A1-IIbeta n=1 Tax=Cinnamomum micranthum f. kanehirae TaxID=337451 RepID=A0A3S3NB71_9MAGN|nr:Phospholipase A1-IIbeta [Cinnamomum micranthum f. kanehirae]